MVKKHEFIDKTVHLVRIALEKLPKEGTLDEMVDKRKELLDKILK